MSFEDTACRCGGTKERDTMLCAQCETDLADHPAIKIFKDQRARVEARRHAGVILLSCAQGLGKQRSKPHPKKSNN